MFNLVIHYELGNHDLLEYITKSTLRYLSKRQRDYHLEKVIIEYIRKFIRAVSIIDKKELFTAFSDEVGQLIQGPEEKVVLKYFDFIKWADSKIENALFAETVKKAI